MTWVRHDSYRTAPLAKKYGKEVVKLGLTKGVKIVIEKKKRKPYVLYILPLN